MTTRSAREVLDDHLQLVKHGRVEEDLARNYAGDAIVLDRRAVFRGHEGVRKLADFLGRELPEASFEYHIVLIEGEFGFLEWSARAAPSSVMEQTRSAFGAGLIVAHLRLPKRARRPAY